MSGFKTKNKHTKDFNLRMIERQAPHPTDQEIKEEVPGHQGDVDFSLMFGEPIRKNRELSYVFKFAEEKRSNFRFQKTVLENWLLDGKKDRIYDDDEMKYYYYGKCVKIDLSKDDYTGRTECVITFDCYPYKIKETVEGSPYWDDYDISDYYQENEFVVNGSKTIQFMNTGAVGVAPEIILDSQMTIIKDGDQFIVSAGKHTVDDFRFEIGMNVFTVTGNGNINFTWYKEVI